MLSLNTNRHKKLPHILAAQRVHKSTPLQHIAIHTRHLSVVLLHGLVQGGGGAIKNNNNKGIDLIIRSAEHKPVGLSNGLMAMLCQ